MSATHEATAIDALPEPERNRRLRRADWRWLLPDPAPARALCIAGAELRAACELVARQVDDAPRPGVAYELVVAESPSAGTLRAVRDAVAPDGVCYTEWPARLPGAAARARARLVRAGFHAPRTYRPWPAVERARTWLPTSGAPADRYWHDAAASAASRRERLHERLGAALARAGVHGRVCAVACASPDRASEPALARLAREHGIDATGGVRLATHGERALGKVVALVHGAAGAPTAAVKAARTPSAASGLAREGELLEAVHGAERAMLPSVPRLLFRARLGEQVALGESAHVGRPLAALLDARHYGALAERVAAWCDDLAAVAAPAEPVWDRIARPVLERFAAEFGAVVSAELLARTHDLLRGIPPLPVVIEQRDLSPWNVLVDGDRLAVLDWESGDPRGVPGLDLLYFLTHAPYYVEHTWVTNRVEETYRRSWSPSTEIGRVNLRCASRHLERLGIDAALLPRLRVLAWVLHAHSDWMHLRDDAGATPAPVRLATSRFLRLYHTELEDVTSC